MQTVDDGSDVSRWKEAQEFAEEIVSHHAGEADLELHSFDSTLRGLKDLSNVGDASGEQTDLVASVESLLSLARNRADRFAGAIVLTDGRQTSLGANSERVALRARGQESPFFVIPIGGEVKLADLALRPSRRQFVAFAGKECAVTTRVSAEGLGSIRPEVVLLNSAGEELDRKRVVLPADGAEVDVSFRIAAPKAGVHLYHFQTALWEGERVEANNSASFTLSVLEGKTRIFMAEGSPYWDSKFLAQMIRRQENMQIVSVYRLSEDRFFRVETGDDLPSQETENTFPATKEELTAYDLIVFGKGADYFLDAKRLALLSEYVREQGGSILFSRGKPYRDRFEGLEFLEPVEWGEMLREPLLLEPTREGELSGLFGEILPGVGDPVWAKLPEPEEAHQVLEVRPFTEVLLNGKWKLDGQDRDLPILASRRYGKGMTASLNMDGLWKWDFFPSEEDGIEGQYESFWSQLIQWAVTYSEFLPGQDLSLHIDQSVLRPGDLIRARVGYRGSNQDAKPSLRLLKDEKEVRVVPASQPGAGSARWEAGFSLPEPGSYRVEAFDQSDVDAVGPSLPITILPPPSETEKLSADPAFLKTFAESSGGRIITKEEIPEIVSMLGSGKRESDQSKAVWRPLWDRAWILPIVLFFAALEWFTRRRNGLL